jgi:hypothetical protein
MILFHKLSELSAIDANLFIAGDFNLPTIDWSSTDYLNIKNYADNSAHIQLPIILLKPQTIKHSKTV